MKPPHVPLPSTCSQTETFHLIGSMPTRHLELIVMLALRAIRCLTRTYPSRHPIEPPHALLPSARSQTETLPPYPQSTYHIPKKQTTPKRQQETQEAIFFRVFCFHKSKRQKPQQNRTKRQKKKQTQKAKRTTRGKEEGGKKRKPASQEEARTPNMDRQRQHQKKYIP